MQEYLSGKNQTQIAKEIGINIDTVSKIVRAPEMSSYIEAKLEEWRGNKWECRNPFLAPLDVGLEVCHF